MSNKKPEMTFKYIFTYDYSPVYVNGAHGGISPRGELVMNFYLERQPLPNAISHEITPAGAIGHPAAGGIRLAVNGALRQNSDLSDMIWSVAAIIARLSQFVELQAGDLIFTGTPEGVGPVQRGDRLEGSIDGIGSVCVTVS